MLRPALWPALAVAVACLLALLEGGVALAHPQIVAIEPIPDSQLSTAPSVVAITFNEAIEGLSTLALYTAQGALVRDGGGRDPSNPARLTLALPPLEPGRYTAVYTGAGSDGHVVRGNFAFSVIGPTSAAAAPAAATAVAGEATPVAPVAPSPSTSAKPRAPIAQSLVRWVLLLGATGWVGGWAYWVWVAFPALGGAVAPPAAVGRWRVWSGVLLALLLVGAPLLLALYVAEITGAVTLPALRSGVGTRQGMLLLTRLGLAVGLLALTLTTRDGATIARRGPLALLLGAALLLVMALGGHAGAAAQPLIPVALIWLHLAATSVWVGGLLLFALTLRPLLRSRPADGRAVLLGDLVARFSRLAIVSVAVLTVSGLARALGELYRWSDLWTSAYGLTLSIKLLLFGGMLALGAYHLLIAGPGIPTGKQTGARCYLFDVLPTLGKLCRVPGPATSEGKDLSAVLEDPAEKGRPRLMFAYRNIQRAICDQRWKLIRYPLVDRTQLFDLQADPFETTDLSGKPEHAARIADLTALLEKEQRSHGDAAP
ncbi:MAG: hypothetical protein HGA45_06575, partial [Chloroflexales bacterium]|nr:hypothetical protein [Chloroflexales bacterium]